MSACFKCKQGIGTVASRDGPRTLYCTDCFLGYCSSVVRDGLFQHCCLPSGTPIAVAVSGGPNSMLLLREVGQLRRKMADQHRRLQHPQQHQRSLPGKEGSPVPPSPPPSSSSLSSSPSPLILLPFHLSEAELILPPLTTTASPSPLTNPHLREAAVERVRVTMQEQFDVLHKLVTQQPPKWVYTDEAAERRCKKSKHKVRKETKEVIDAGEEGGSPVMSDFLFGLGEVRLFRYSDFLPPSYLAEVSHALHVSKLSLTDREALYDRVRQQVLCRAAKRVIDEYNAQQSPTSTGAEGEEEQRRSAGAGDDGPAASSSLAGAPTAWFHLLVGSNAARCAAAALEAVVTGAGGDGVVHASAFRGLLHDVVCLRPMRTLLPKETVLCSRLHGISASYTPALRTGTTLRSMRQTLESFVCTMMLSYRTMIFNVLNTVQKLEVHPGALQQLVQFAAVMSERGGSGRTTPTSSAGPVVRGPAKALPGRTAQQNQRDLSSCSPPYVYHTPSAVQAASPAREGGNVRDVQGHSAESWTEPSVAVQCCVCGCPASWPASINEHSAATSASHHVDVCAVEEEGGNDTVTLDCFVCYACRSLFEAWPASALTDSSEAKQPPEAASASPTNALHAGCAIFQ